MPDSYAVCTLVHCNCSISNSSVLATMCKHLQLKQFIPQPWVCQYERCYYSTATTLQPEGDIYIPLKSTGFLHCTTDYNSTESIVILYYVDGNPISIGHGWIASGLASIEEHEHPIVPGSSSHRRHSVMAINGVEMFDGKKIHCECVSGNEISRTNITLVHIMQPSRASESKQVFQYKLSECELQNLPNYTSNYC